MTIEQTIQKAIEGGYKLFDKTAGVEIHTNTWPMVYSEKGGIPKLWPLHSILYDPLFWQSFGEAMEWKGNGWNKKPLWQNEWHSFIDHLAEGKDIESFFNQF